MTDNLVSLHGRRLGLTATGMLSGDDASPPEASFRGIEVGLTGRSYFDIISPIYTQGILDDFLGASISSAIWTHPTKGSDGGTVDFAVRAAQAGGQVRGTTGAGAGGTMAVNGIVLSAARNFLVSNGPSFIDVRMQTSAITNINLFIGFSDTTVSTLQAPFTISGSTVTANATNAVGFCFDTAATAATWKLLSVLNGGTPQLVDSGNAGDTAAFHRFRVGVDAAGNATFFIDGARVGANVSGQSYNIAAAVQTTAILGPWIEGFTRTAASANLDLDWVAAQQRLTTTR